MSTGRAGRRAQGPGGDWLTLGQAATYLGVAQSTIRKWSDGGRLPAFYTPGGHRRFRQGDLDAFLAGSRGAPAEAEAQLVLVVDDDESLREFVRANLELEGFAVREAANAEEGLSALDAGPPDLILLDVMMPEADGWEMLRRMQEKHGVGTIPVIMFSGKLDAGNDAEQRGAQAFIGKPFDPQQLVDATKQLLRS